MKVELYNMEQILIPSGCRFYILKKGNTLGGQHGKGKDWPPCIFPSAQWLRHHKPASSEIP
jgi:hypothetical protein